MAHGHTQSCPTLNVSDINRLSPITLSQPSYSPNSKGGKHGTVSAKPIIETIQEDSASADDQWPPTASPTLTPRELREIKKVHGHVKSLSPDPMFRSMTLDGRDRDNESSRSEFSSSSSVDINDRNDPYDVTNHEHLRRFQQYPSNTPTMATVPSDDVSEMTEMPNLISSPSNSTTRHSAHSNSGGFTIKLNGNNLPSLDSGEMEPEDNDNDNDDAKNPDLAESGNDSVSEKGNVNDASRVEIDAKLNVNRECKRIIFMYNSKSGGQKALTLIKYFKAYTSSLFDLLALNQSEVIRAELAKDLIRYQHMVVVCPVGGDGSQCWAASLIDKCIAEHSEPISPPVIVPFPVGTGNDLSRSLGWGNLERTPEKIIKHVADIEYCFGISRRFSKLDRWGIQYTFPHLQHPQSHSRQSTTLTVDTMNTMNELTAVHTPTTPTSPMSVLEPRPTNELNDDEKEIPNMENDANAFNSMPTIWSDPAILPTPPDPAIPVGTRRITETIDEETITDIQDIQNVEIDDQKQHFQGAHSEPQTVEEYVNNTFSPPLPKSFLCYLSFGYDAMITYNFAMERKKHPERFKSQLSNQSVYIKMGIQELLQPSQPIDDCIELTCDGERIEIPKNTRSLKLVNINSAANGIFFWGYMKSNKNELQRWRKPKLDDKHIEVMGTQGTTDLVSAKTHLGHAHRLAQSKKIKIQVTKAPVYLQIDGEGWYIEKECTLQIQLQDQLDTLIGYKEPRGVRKEYTMEFYTDKVKRARHRFRDRVRVRYNIPTHFTKDYDPLERARERARGRSKSRGKKRKRKWMRIMKQNSTDDFDLNLSGKHTTYGPYGDGGRFATPPPLMTSLSSGNLVDAAERSRSIGPTGGNGELLITPQRSFHDKKRGKKRWSLKMKSKSRSKSGGKKDKNRRMSLF